MRKIIYLIIILLFLTIEVYPNNIQEDSLFYTITNVKLSDAENKTPDFEWMQNNEVQTLSALKGKVVLINIWATWCGPCVREIPDLDAVSKEFSNSDFKMIGIDVFEDEEMWNTELTNFLKKRNLSYTILKGNPGVVDAFSKAIKKTINAIPTTIIIDKDGNIAEFFTGSKEKTYFTEIINKYLK